MRFPKSNSVGFTLTELLVVVGILGLLMILGMPVATRMMQGAKSTTCISNLRQLSSVVLNYSFENRGDILPVIFFHDTTQRTGEPWFRELHVKGYLPASQWNRLEKSIMRCPERKLVSTYDLNGTVQGLHYGLNEYPGFRNVMVPGLVPLRKVTSIEPSKVVMFGEISAQYAIYPRSNDFRIYPHSGGSNVVYFDGHAQFQPNTLPLVPSGEPSGENTTPFY